MLFLMGALVGGLWSVTAFCDTAASYLDLSFRQDRYLDGVDNVHQSENYSTFGVDLNWETQTPGFSYKFNPIGQFSIGVPNEVYYGVPEFFVQPRQVAPGLNLTIGRQRRVWSRLDEEFNLGVWQPQLRWDYLAPKQEGLIGVFFDWSVSSNLQFTFFTSPLYLPDQGPNFQLKDGEFTSSNRWFLPPTNSLNFNNQAAPLDFVLERPTNESIIMNSSFALAVNYQWDSPFWLQMEYAYKPQNQIHLGVDCSTCSVIGGPLSPLEIDAVIHPIVVKHNVATLEAGFDRVDDRGYLSVTGDFPNSSGFPTTYFESPLDSMIIAGGAYQYYVYRWLGFPAWVKFAYLKLFDVHARDKQSLVDSDQVQSSLDRYPFREVAALDWKFLLRQQHLNHVQINARYTYSIPEKGTWISASLEWVNGPLTWSAGLDFLGSETSPAAPNAGLFTRYRNNDRVFGGVGYVF